MTEKPLVCMSDDVSDLVELSRVLVAVAYRSLGTSGRPLPLPQFRAMATLMERGPCTVGTLADRLDTPPSSMTRLCDRLVAADWITRSTRPENRREVEVDLTSSGRAVTLQALAARAAELERILQRLPRPRRRALAALLPDLLRAAAGDASVESEGQAV